MSPAQYVTNEHLVSVARQTLTRLDAHLWEHTAAVEELRAAKVAEHQIQTLYPWDWDGYTAALTALFPDAAAVRRFTEATAQINAPALEGLKDHGEATRIAIDLAVAFARLDHHSVAIQRNVLTTYHAFAALRMFSEGKPSIFPFVPTGDPCPSEWHDEGIASLLHLLDELQPACARSGAASTFGSVPLKVLAR